MQLLSPLQIGRKDLFEKQSVQIDAFNVNKKYVPNVWPLFL